MADYENSIFNNLPRRRQGAGVLDDERPSWREVLSMRNFDEGPLPPRPHVSGKGGPSIKQGSKPVATSVWSASDAATNAMTLSNGGMTATTTVAANKTIRGSVGQSSGKVYVEFLAVATFGNDQFGLASASFNSSGQLGSSNYSGGVGYGGNLVSTGFTSNYTTTLFPAVNDVWAIAVDFAAGGFWLAKNNVWIGGSNPATGSLPIISFVSATVGALFPGIVPENNGEVWTLQPTAASQKYAPPSGFSAWG